MNTRWFRTFSHDPQMAVKDLFSGRAGVGSSMRLEVPELLRLWFPPNLTEERARLDRALLAWLVEMRESYTSQVEHLGFSVFSKRVVDALIALQLLDLPWARGEIRDSVDAWLRWLLPLRLAPERDPALECHRLLTQGQPDSRHTATWLRLAADRRSEYLTVALAGLELLPNSGDASKNQTLMLQALLRHATTKFHEVNGARKFFNRQFGALRGLYPRGPQHWQHVLEEALPRFQHQVPSQIAEDMVKELWKRQPARQGRSLPPRRAVPKQEWTALLTDIRDTLGQPEELARRLFGVLEKNDDYALETGDSYPFVTTLCNLGKEMLERHTLSVSDMDRLGTLIERALTWEQVNPYCWMLWAQWYQVQGRGDAEEAILREMLRMFPRDAPSHVELARLLIRRGENNWLEAEHYLRRAMAQDPNDGHPHVVMARLQVLRGRQGEAEATLAGFLADHPENEEAQSLLSRLQAGLFTDQTAPPGDTPRSVYQGDGTLDISASVASALHEVLRRGNLAAEFSRARLANGNVSTTQIRRESRVGDPLAGFYSQWLQLDDTPACPPHAWAWNACQHWQQAAAPETWRDLAERFPEAALETDFLRGLACPEAEDSKSRRHYRGTQEGASARAVDTLMREMADMWDQLVVNDNATQQVRDEAACAVMACAAANAPEFTASLD